MTLSKSLAPLLCALVITGCGDDNLSDAEYTAPDDYTFSSRTNTDFSSSVSNEVSISQELLKQEFLSLIRSPQIEGSITKLDALSSLNRVFNSGVEGLNDYNIYTGLVIEPTPISMQLTSGRVLQQSDFSALSASANLFSSMELGSEERKLPFTATVESEVDGETVEEVIGEFIGWELLADISDGNEMPLALIENWLEIIAEAVVRGEQEAIYITEDGKHLDLLIEQLILGATNYSTLSQYSLASDKGLLSQNTDPVNIETVNEQKDLVELQELRLELAESDLELFEELEQTYLDNWLEADGVYADPSRPLTYYTEDLFQYSYVDLARAYYLQVDRVAGQKNVIASTEVLLELATNDVDDLLPYTHLANVWDEAFGYFGAARNYGAYTDLEVSTTPDYDENSDGVIDVYSELNLGYAIMASERDSGASLMNTDFSTEIWDAFVMGRHIIQENHGRDAVENVGYHLDLKGQADIIILALEKVISSTIIHHINEVIKDINVALEDEDVSEFDSFEYSYFKNWSILKGMALTLQFNSSPMISKEELLELHVYIGDSPSPETSNLYGARRTQLVAARALIQNVYGFAESNAEAW